MQKKLKLSVLGDLHFGKQKNCETFLHNQLAFFYDQYLPEIREAKPDRIYILGDVFDSRNVVNVNVLNKVQDLMEEMSKVCSQIYILVGNHDIVYNTTLEVTSLNAFKWIPNITIVDSIIELDSGNFKDVLVPWQVTDNDFTKNLGRQHRVFGHFDITGAKMTGGIRCEHGMSLDKFKKVHSVFTGHFHIRQKIGNVQYVGSPYQLDRGDRDDVKGYYIINDNDVEFVENKKSAKFKSFAYPAKATEQDVKGNIVDVILSAEDYSNKKYLSYIEKINEFKPLYNAKIKIISEEQEDQQLEIKHKTLKEMLSDYIQTLKIENKEEITARMLELMQEAE